MKLGYYSYCIKNRSDQLYQTSIKQLLTNFCSITDKDFTKSFEYAGDKIFLIRVNPNIFLFALTRDDELIKAINQSSLQVDDIYARLNDDEKLGFGSYIYIDNRCFYGLASTMKGPKNKIWNDFVNMVLARLGLNSYQFISFPIYQTATPDEVEDLEFIGNTIFELTPEHRKWKDLLKGLSDVFTPDEFNFARSITVNIKPEPRQSLQVESFKKINTQITESLDGLEKYIVKGKSDLEDNLTEFFIVQKGHLSDPIRNTAEVEIYREIQRRIEENDLLSLKLTELNNQQLYEDQDNEDIIRFNSLDTFRNTILGT